MRSAKPLCITKKAATTLNQWCRSTTLPHGQIMRAKIILQLVEGMTPTEVAKAHRTSAKTVHRWRNRFETEGIDGLLERPRSGRPTVIDKETVDKVMFLTTKRIPEEATHWSIELMARYAEVTPWQVRQIWKAADLRPHRLKTFKISTDPYMGRLAYFRVYSGVVRRGEALLNTTSGKKERIGRLVRMHADHREEVEVVVTS